MSISANNLVTINGDVIAKGNGANGGDIDIASTHITLSATGLLDTRANGQTSLVNAGDVTLIAHSDVEVGFASADSNTSIKIYGDIRTGNLSAEAFSRAASSYYNNIAGTIALKAISSYLGADFAYMEADATAEVLVFDGADIKASGDISLNAEAHSLTEAIAVAALGGATKISLAGIYAVSDATSDAIIYSGALLKVVAI